MTEQNPDTRLPLQHIPRGWSARDLSNLEGKRFLITGATSGIGKEAARELVRAGATVIISGRNPEKAEQTRKELSSDRVSTLILDLADLNSIRKAAREVTDQIDVLILNAGVMAVPFTKTADDFELQMGTNHLGHFAFAGLIADRVSSRIVTVSSQAHRTGSFVFLQCICCSSRLFQYQSAERRTTDARQCCRRESNSVYELGCGAICISWRTPNVMCSNFPKSLWSLIYRSRWIT